MADSEELKYGMATRDGKIALLLSENSRLKAIVIGNEMEIENKDKRISELEKENEMLKKEREAMGVHIKAINELLDEAFALI